MGPSSSPDFSAPMGDRNRGEGDRPKRELDAPRYACAPARVLPMFNWLANSTVRTARRVVIAIVGATIIAVGIAMLVLPGPGIVVIGAGLAFLSIEFAFAQRWLRTLRKRSAQAADQAGIPPRMRRVIIIGGIVLGGVMMLVPGCVVVVHTADGWEVLRNNRFSYAHSWTSEKRLEHAAEAGDEGAAWLLQSVHQRRASANHEEMTP